MKAQSALSLAIFATACCTQAAEPLRYNRDIRPILSDNCFACHGPDLAERKAGLRLDVREAALAPAKSGDIAIVPGDLKKSALIERIMTDDADEIMPPPKSHKKLTAAQKETLKRWIAEGAQYEQHWAFMPVQTAKVPAAADFPKADAALLKWPRNPVDWFVMAKLDASGLRPSPEVGKEALIRRVTLDLTGLPPTLSEVNAFLADTSPDAYEKVVTRLLASPRYGERMALDWLDAARYADTNGYQIDRDRELWPWRDWVIAAFNRNLAFDQFTIEQLAGDLLPNPTQDQRVATGFHRNTMFNEEGGVDPAEFLAEYTADRVETTMTVWQAQTFNCCRCHDHKFDPFSQREFYSMKAFFNTVTELGKGEDKLPIQENSPPQLRLAAPDIEAKIKMLREQLAQKEKLPGRPKADKEAAALKKQIKDAELSIPTSMVMAEMEKPRPTFVLKRGAFDAPGERVQSATPKVLPAMPATLPRNRLGLARWLVSPENPLTSRVAVNRFWQQVFGTGIVKTSDNFGAQGEHPTHPELLDWLARDFVANHWDVKRLMKMLVTSATYRQGAALTPRLLELDPENRLLARSSRNRLAGEFIRDQALAASGLLAEKIGGPSVKPYHPPGIYEQLTSGKGTTHYVPGTGQDLRRRSLYTYWKRSVPHPAMLAFGTPFREVCTVQRTRSNTPLQALNLMNDETYVEAARSLAVRTIASSGDNAGRLKFAFRTVLARAPRPDEQAILEKALQRSLADFRKDTATAKAFLAVGTTPAPAGLDPAELAAWSTVAGTILRMDETITRP